jgi:DNA-binding CsgD family transcriptional regulator
MGTASAFLGDPEDSERRHAEAERRARPASAFLDPEGEARFERASGHREHPEDMMLLCSHRAEVLRLAGDAAGALEVVLRGVEEAKRLGLHRSFARSLSLTAAEDLYRLGRWDEADARLAELERTHLRYGSRLLYDIVRGRMALARGAHDTAVRHLESAASSCSDTTPWEYRVTVQAGLCELELAGGEPGRALARVRTYFALGPAQDPLYTPVLYALGTRAAADLGREHEAEASELLAGVDGLIARHSRHRAPPEAVANRALCAAELDRLEAEPTSAPWSEAAEAWERLSQPLPVAYARWREAEAAHALGDDAHAARALGAARLVAVRLGATGLTEHIERLAASKRLSRQLLTPREREVLRPLVAGHTNAQIAQELVLNVRTVETHVEHILRKLDVSTRTAAAAAARSRGLLDPELSRPR